MLKSYENLKTFLSKHSNCFSILALALFCYLFLFFRLGAYPLLDVDETRYVAISKAMYFNKNWITPFLNNIPFLEKPPLYFWLTVLSYKVFGTIGDFASRFSTAALATFAVFFTYFFGKKALGQAFGLISAFILLTNIWFLIFSHIVLLDMGFMVLTMASIYSVLLSMYCREKNKKFCWWAGYFFMALAVLMKGLIGVMVPALVVFFSFLATKNLKEIFKPAHWFFGAIIFIIVAAPWHYFVLAQNNGAWVQEYIVKHHLARFMDSSMGLGRKQPFWFYIPIIIGGFMPWTMSLLAACTSRVKIMIKDFKSTKSIKPIFSTDTNDKKMLVTMSIYFLATFLFFSISSSKLPTYILCAFPPLTMLCGYYWWGYISYGKFTRGIVISSSLTIALLIIGALVGVNAGLFATLPVGIESFRMFGAGWIIVMSLIALLCLLAKNRALLFVSHVVLMLGIIIIATSRIFPFITTTGQTELEKYADKANSVSGSALVTFDFPSKYSVLHHFSGPIIYIREADFGELNKVKTSPVYVIVKNANFEDYKDSFKKYEIIERGQKYTLLVK